MRGRAVSVGLPMSLSRSAWVRSGPLPRPAPAPGSLFRRMAILACFVALAGAAGLGYLRLLVQDQLPHQIETRINRHLAGSGLSVSLGSAVWQEGQGLSVRDVVVRFGGSGEVTELAAIEQVFVRSSFRLTDLLQGWPQIDELLIQGLAARVAQDETGNWNIQQVVDRLSRWERPASPMQVDFPVRLRDSSLQVDATPGGLCQPFQLADIRLDYRRIPVPNAGERVMDRITGQFGSSVSGPVRFDLNIRPDDRIWDAAATLHRLEFAESIRHTLACWFPGQAELIQQTVGRISVQASARGRLGELEIPEFRLAGQVEALQCFSARLPHPVHHGEIEFSADNERLQITRARCGFGYGQLSGSCELRDWQRQGEWLIDIEAGNVELTERMLPWLSEKLQSAWHQFQPGGVIDGTFRFVFRDGHWQRTIRSTVSGGTVSYFRFPYRLNGCEATISMDDHVLTLQGTAIEAQQTVRYQAEIVNPGPDWTGWFEGKCDGKIPINEKMLQAFDVNPGLAATLRRFHSTGHVSGKGRIERRTPDQPAEMRHEVRIHQANLCYDAFPYPFYNVNGTVIVERDRTRFHDISGMNNNGEVVCNGSWTRAGDLDLVFSGKTIPLDLELKQAVPAGVQQIWDELRPAGMVDQVYLALRWNRQMVRPYIDLLAEVGSPESFAEIGSRESRGGGTVSFNPVSFPWELRQVTGRFRYHGNQIDIEHLSGMHGRTSVNFRGAGTWDQEQWSIRLTDLVASNIAVDRELLDAMPESLAEGIEAVRLDGLMSVRGTVELGGRHKPVVGRRYVDTTDPATGFRLAWNVDIGIGQGSLWLGLPLQGVNGVVSLQGQCLDDQLFTRGDLSIDSLMYGDVQVTRVTGPVLADNDRIAMGSLARSPSGTPTPRSVSAELFGGQVLGDAQINLAGDCNFVVQAKLAEGDLQQMAEECSGVRHDIGGRADAALRLYGNTTGTHSIEGSGFVKLVDARLYRQPVILALFNVLRIQEPDRTAFDAGQIGFTVHGEDIELDRIELNGNAISLIGSGHANLEQEIDLDFYTVIGRNRFTIPLITELFQFGSQQILWIEVDGTLDNPHTTNNVLPGLNDSLRALFPELEHQQSGSRR